VEKKKDGGETPGAANAYGGTERGLIRCGSLSSTRRRLSKGESWRKHSALRTEGRKLKTIGNKKIKL